jgi:predicted lysophospholipase L1 biosynthesis ABC-type transport system permease subunit
MNTSPSRRDRTRPAELLGLSGVIAVFVAAIALMSSRDLMIAVIALGGVFIIALVTFATINLTETPSETEQLDLDEQDRAAGH